MKTILAFAPIALALNACTAYADSYAGRFPPAQPAYPGGETYRAIGTEPFWDLRIGSQMVFTDRGIDFSVTQPTPRPIIGIAGEIYRTPRIEVNVNHVRCSDGMSDRIYPDTVQVRVDGRDYRGCGAASSWFNSIDERGEPRPPAGEAVPLEHTRWRVVAVNGRPTPSQGDYSVQFENGRLSAKFGCNYLGASYSQAGSTIDAGTVVATRKLCPDMSFETQGTAILKQVMVVRTVAPNRISLTSSAGVIDLVRT